MSTEPGPPTAPPSPEARVGEPIVLSDDLEATDLRGKIGAAWQDFARALARALPTLPPDAELEVTLDPTASGTGDAVYAIRVLTGPEGELAVYAVGNAALPAGYRLDRTGVASMIELGWSPPGVVEGSGADFGLRASVEEAGRLAALISRTMRDVYGAPHPAFLTYAVTSAAGTGSAAGGAALTPLAAARPAPTLELEAAPAHTARPTPPADELAEEVRTVVAALLKIEPEQLEIDADGEISVRAGSAMVFVRVHANPPMVDVYSPILTEVRPNEKLYQRLSQLTRRMPIGRLYFSDSTVWASVPVFGRDFQPTHLMLAVQVMTGLADELDDRLHGEFGGKRFFGEGDAPAGRVGEERTGMYL